MKSPLASKSVYALGAAVLFGASTPLAKSLVGSIDPALLAALLYLGSGVGLGLFWLIQTASRITTNETPLRRRDWPWLAGATVFGGVAGPLLLMYGLSLTTGSTASLLLNLEAVFTMLLAWRVFGENIDRRIAFGMVMIVIGGIVLVWGGPVQVGSLWGVVAVSAACLCWGVDNNLTARVSGGNPLHVACIKGLVAGTVNMILALSLGAALPTGSLLAKAGILGLAGYGLSLMLFVLALRHLGSARTGAYFSTAPFVGTVVALIVLREPLTLSIGVAAVLMAVGVWLHLTERHEHEHVHEQLRHEHRHQHDPHHQHEHGPTDSEDETHAHEHAHDGLAHVHPHYPDLHHHHAH
ncbi:MAG: DMT family transporter [Armatimonadota bacterium]